MSVGMFVSICEQENFRNQGVKWLLLLLQTIKFKFSGVFFSNSFIKCNYGLRSFQRENTYEHEIKEGQHSNLDQFFL